MNARAPVQLTLDQEGARQAAHAGMKEAVDHANRVVSKWSDLAYLFLTSFCRGHLSFISEDVSSASKQFGMVQPPTDRAWGAVYQRAVKAEMIVMDGTGRSNRRHRSLCPRWRSKIFCTPAA